MVPIGGGPHVLLGLKIAHELAREWGTSLAALKIQMGQGVADARSEYEKQSIALSQSQAEDSRRDILAQTDVPAEVELLIGTDSGRMSLQNDTFLGLKSFLNLR